MTSITLSDPPIPFYRRDFDVALPPDREIRMSSITVPPELYRRKTAHKLLMRAIESIRVYKDATELDWPAAQEAGLYAIAAEISQLVRRGDLAIEFQRLAQESMVRVASARPMRRRAKGRPRPEKPKDPDIPRVVLKRLPDDHLRNKA